MLALDSNDYADQLRTGEAVMGLGWTGGVVELRDEPETADTEYIVPERRDAVLDGHLGHVRRCPAPRGRPTPGSTSSTSPTIQAQETNTNRYATPNDAAKELVDPAILDDPAMFVAGRGLRRAWRARRTCRPTRSGPRSGRSSAPASAADDSDRRGPADDHRDRPGCHQAGRTGRGCATACSPALLLLPGRPGT